MMVAPETRWQKQWKDIEDKVSAAPLKCTVLAVVDVLKGLANC